MGARILRFSVVRLFPALLIVIFTQLDSAQAAPIVITQTRGSLFFGSCDNIPNQTYTVDPADNPGIAGCTGAFSARFDITGDVSAKVVISLPNRVDVTNGTDTFRVNLSTDDTGGNPPAFDVAGDLVIWVGGNFRVPAALGSSGLFTAQAVWEVIYK